MPRQGRSGGGGRAPSRPSVAPRPAPPKQQTRPATTAAYPPQKAGPPPAAPAAPAQQGSAGPGLFGQMASTAAGVAVGSSIGHAIGGFFGGGAQPAEQQSNGAVATQGNEKTESWGAPSCNENVKQFTTCMDEQKGNMSICGWYLDQLKACQKAAENY